MKHFLVVIFSIINTLFVYAEVYNFQATDVSVRVEKEDGSWSDWTEWTGSNATMSYDTDKDKVKVITDKNLSFDVYNVTNESDGDGGNVISLSCVDDNGLKCAIDIRNAKSGGLQVYLRYGDINAVFNVNEPYNIRKLFPNYIPKQKTNSTTIDNNTTNTSLYLYVSKTSIACSASGTTDYLSVNCNGNWSIQYPSSSMYSATRNGNTITVHITPNYYTTSRSDFFNVVCGDKVVKVSLSQSGKPSSTSSSTSSAASLSVSKTSIITGSSGTTEYLTVSSNRAWEIQYPTGGMYSVTRSGNTLKVTIYANTSSGTRENFFNVRLADGSKVIKVKLWQSGRATTSQSSSTSYGSSSSRSYSGNRASNRSTYHQSAYQRFINTNGSVAITWFGMSGEIGTGATFTESLLRFRLGPIELRPLDITGGYNFIYGTTYFAYQPILDFYIPTSSDKALYFGAGPSIGSGDREFWFRAEGGLHWEWGVYASSDFYFRYDGMYTAGVSIQWSSAWM